MTKTRLLRRLICKTSLVVAPAVENVKFSAVFSFMEKKSENLEREGLKVDVYVTRIERDVIDATTVGSESIKLLGGEVEVQFMAVVGSSVLEGTKLFRDSGVDSYTIASFEEEIESELKKSLK